VDLHNEVATGALKVAPSATLVGAQFFGLGLPDWAAIAGIAFVVLQTAHLLWKWRRDLKAKRS